MHYTFNGRYDDLEQVEPYLEEFTELREAEVAAGRYPYNDSFLGRIPGIAGPHEENAIYMLQGLYRQRQMEAKITALLADGYEHLDALDDTARFANVVLYRTHRMGGEWAEYEDARVVPEGGKPYGVLPKGRRTNGSLIMGRRVLVRAR